LLGELRDRHGADFARVLGICTVLVDGSGVARDAEVEVRDGAEVALLPPVSGGAGPAADAARTRRGRAGRMRGLHVPQPSAIPGG
jgi:hypothetical protein